MDDRGNQEYLQLIKERMSARASSRSPKRGRSAASRTSGGRQTSAKSTTSKKSSGENRSKSPPKSRLSSAQSEGLMGNGKPSTITSRRVRLRSADLENRGLRMVDMSGQGLTAVGGSMFSRKDVGELDLSSNNLRVIPPEIRRLTTVVHLDLSRNGIRCGHQQDFTGLPKELAQLPNLEVLLISECNLPFIPPAIWLCRKLRVLDISRNKINYLVPDIGNLERLQHLNAQQTSILTLPPEIALCQELEEVMLWGNVIESLPETLKEMPKLKTLAVNFRSFCTTVDAYREGLLMKGQIQSEHIPPVLFEMPALDGLDLNETKLNTLPDSCVGRLREFYIAQNFFNKFPLMLLSMQTLEVLDLSNNMVKRIPEQIGDLVNLTTFKMDDNKVEVFPTTLGRLKKLTSLRMGGNELYSIPDDIGELTSLKTLVLDRNKIRSIPDTIVNLEELETLDLTDNRITTLPANFYKIMKISSAHTYQKFHKYGLWLHKNPLSVPPHEVWKTDNPEHIFKYMKRLQIQRTENLQRQKLYILGDSQCGKTSLVHAITTGKSALTQSEVDSTAMIDFVPWKTDNGVDFLIHDIGGAAVYKKTHHLFLDPKGIYLIVYDQSSFSKEVFQDMIGYWLDLIQVHVPGAIVKIVGTKVDTCDSETIERLTQEVDQEIEEYLAARKKKLDDLVTTIDKMQKDEAKTKQEQDHYKQQKFKTVALKRQPLKIQPHMYVSSADGIFGILNLVNDLEMIAVDKDLCPHAQHLVPNDWFQLRLSLKARKDLCLSFDEVKAIAKAKKFARDQVKDCLTFLAECGEILWFQEIPALKHFIFQRPRKLVDVLKGFFRHDAAEFLNFENNRIFKCQGQMTEDIFNKDKYMLHTHGQISRSMLQCLWFYLNLSKDNFDYLLELIPSFDLCFLIPEDDIPKAKNEFTPILAFPSLNQDTLTSADDLKSIWPYPLPPGQTELVISTTFPLNEPAGLFENFACKLHNLVTFREDWTDAIFAEVDTGAILIQRSGSEHTVKVRGVDLQNTRSIMSEVSAQLVQALGGYQGLVWLAKLSTDNCDKVEVQECFSENIFINSN